MIGHRNKKGGDLRQKRKRRRRIRSRINRVKCS